MFDSRQVADPAAVDHFYKYSTSVQFGNTFLLIGGACDEGNDCEAKAFRTVLEYVPATETFIRRSEKLDSAVGESAAVMTGKQPSKRPI